MILQIFLAFASARLLGRPVADRHTSVVGELLAGAIIGPQLLGWLDHNQFLDALSELGVILLLFTAGLETHIRDLAEVKGTSAASGRARRSPAVRRGFPSPSRSTTP